MSANAAAPQPAPIPEVPVGERTAAETRPTVPVMGL
jgi:hypothetical protein